MQLVLSPIQAVSYAVLHFHRPPSSNEHARTDQTIPNKMPWKIQPITISDAPAVARNTCGAFWEEPMWRLQWTPDITQDFLATQLVKRQPLRLFRDRDTLRHQKAVDPSTGDLVGYARWRLPDGRSSTADGEPEWADAQIPDLPADERKALEDEAAGVWWEPRTDVDELDEGNGEVKERITGGREHMGEFLSPPRLALRELELC